MIAVVMLADRVAQAEVEVIGAVGQGVQKHRQVSLEIPELMVSEMLVDQETVGLMETTAEVVVVVLVLLAETLLAPQLQLAA
tara:strand:+ start:389 stop:634 length:246 start_codon:yes stop_codon:yes gene_type:complete